MPYSGPDSPEAFPGPQPQTMRDELLRHLDAAFNLARWLSRNDHDAQDIVQESLLRAVRFGGQCRGESVRAWLLQIVRNTCHTWLARNRAAAAPAGMLEEAAAPDSSAPDLALQRRQDAGAVRRAIGLLPEEFREVILLREIEGLALQGDRANRGGADRDGDVAPRPRAGQAQGVVGRVPRGGVR
jgi:RNA polymerase sigma-70 factor (ECF subfamily)